MEKTIWQSRQIMLSSNFEIFHYSDNNFKEVKLHHHEFYEIYFLIKGNVVYTIEGKIYNLSSNDLLIIPPYKLHQMMINEENNNYERIIFWLSRKFVAELSTINTNLSKVFANISSNQNNLIQSESNIEIKLLLENILNLNNSKKYGDDVKSRIYITNLLLKLNSLKIIENDINQPLLINKILDYINNNLTNNLSIKKIAQDNFISTSYLSHIFKKYIGASIHKYLTKKRLILAVGLIEQGIPIIEVYQQSGFKDYSGFFNIFKQEYGMTPKQFFYSINK